MEKISYDELYANAYNKSWSGWKKLGKIMEIVERLGSKSRNYPDSKVKHALNFLNSYLVEKRVKDKLHLNWNGEDHDGIYVKRGDAFPDFVDANGDEVKPTAPVYVCINALGLLPDIHRGVAAAFG